MEVIIEGKQALVKPGQSFDYIWENRLFTDADGYTLSIEFPLRGCAQNIAIFGHLNRHDIDRGITRLYAEISAGPYFHKYGVITILAATEEMVKGQFLEGRSVHNFDRSLDNIYINALTIDVPSVTIGKFVWDWDLYRPIDTNTTGCVAIPWVNDASGNIQNCVEKKDGSNWELVSDSVSVMPYLLRLTEWICRAIGYTCDLSAWLAHPQYKHLISCNCLPAAWESKNLAEALPHWSVTEYFSELEKLMNCKFDINYANKHISMAFSSELTAQLPVVALPQIVDTLDVQITDTDESGFADEKIYSYVDRDDEEWKFLDCQWLITQAEQGVQTYSEYDIAYDFIKYAIEKRNYTPINSNDPEWIRFKRLHHIKPKPYDCWATFECYGLWNTQEKLPDGTLYWPSANRPRLLNIFADSKTSEENPDAEKEELRMIPAYINRIDRGWCLFVNAPSESMPVDLPAEADPPKIYPAYNWNSGEQTFYEPAKITDGWEAEWRKTYAIRQLEHGEPEKPADYYSSMTVAFWDGDASTFRGDFPCPFIDSIRYTGTDQWDETPYSLRLRGRKKAYRGQVNTKAKYTFSFLSDSIPNPRSVFAIRGQRFVCAKITATIDDNGLQMMMKGEFYRIKG